MAADPTTVPGTVDTIQHATGHLIAITLVIGGIGVGVAASIATLVYAWRLFSYTARHGGGSGVWGGGNDAGAEYGGEWEEYEVAGGDEFDEYLAGEGGSNGFNGPGWTP